MGVKVGNRCGRLGSSNDASNMLLETRQALVTRPTPFGIAGPPEGPARYAQFARTSLRASEWMTAREAFKLATIGGAKVLGRDRHRFGLEPGKMRRFFQHRLAHRRLRGCAQPIPVAAIVFCAPQRARYTVVHGRIVVDNKLESPPSAMGPVVAEHNRWSLRLAG